MGGMFRQYYWIVDLVGIIACSYFLAKMTGIFIGESIEVKRSIAVVQTSDAVAPERQIADRNDYNVIVERDIFDASAKTLTEGEAAGSSIEELVASGEAVPTSLDISVIGVLVVGEGTDKRSTATVAGGGGGEGDKKKGGGRAAGVYAVGDEESFAPNTRLTKVQPDRIEFIHGERLEFAEVSREFGTDIFGPPVREPIAMLDKGKGEAIRPEEPGKFTVDRREVDDALQNLDRLYTEIRAVPNFSGGKVAGMKVLSIKSGSLFSKLGLRRGDILKSINGVELDVKKGFEIFNQLKDETNISLNVIRQGAPTTLDYEIR